MSSKNKIIIIHSIGLVCYWIIAALVVVLGGCEAYGLEGCSKKHITMFAILTVVGVIPIALSQMLNVATYIILLIYSITVIVALAPIGTVLGIISLINLHKWKSRVDNTS